ncbi:MAG TPA: protein translocase subunit SecD [Verrucomicrobiae bacterium]|nr:protein translocase subunit SecD [Verrucomicrobiae bacterium]
MNRNSVWRFVLVAVVVLWSVYELYPPRGMDLVQYFRERAVNQQDATFKEIYQRAAALDKAAPEKAYDDLVEAIGTNDITRYFPFFDAKTEPHPTAYILNRLQREPKAAGRIRLGLDLQGGTSFLVSMDTSSLTNSADTSSALSQAVEVLRKRVDRFGVAEPLIQPQGRNQILVQLPGLSAADQENARIAIQKAAFLQFKLVHEDSKSLIEQGITPPGYEVMSHVKVLPNGSRQVEKELVKKRAEMTGGIKSAMVTRDNLGQPEINFTLDSEHADLFGKLTRENVGRQLAVILDGELQTAPVIRSPIEGGSGVIQGDYSQQEAFQLQTVLENPLRAPLKIDASRQVDPTLGKDSIRSGVRAAIYGTLAVSAFMLVYYMIAGLVANVALLANIVILLGVMCSIGTTLTLPGIAGVVLTVGMAVDANVLIYERIREESGKGKSLRGAISAGYSRAFGTIFDSHVTTLISSVILIFMGTGPIKGFGVSLTIGVAASLFTALVVTRMIFDWLLERGWLKSVPMLHLIPATMKLDFMKLAKPAFITSWLIIAVGVGWGFHRGKSAFGRDFVGGTSSTFTFAQKEPDVERLRAALKSAGVKDALIQYQKDLVTGRESLRVDSGAGTGQEVKAALTDKFPAAQFHLFGQDSVGASVGKDIRNSAIIASLLSLFGILVYVAFRYEFSFAVGAVLAVIHDVLMTIGIYYLSGKEFNATSVAAILTIIGFSTNDTIVIFDRIREDLKLGVRGTFKEVMNQALNQTLSRTIITSGTVFLATLSLFIFGGGEINDFAFTFLIGIITGTYSSIYIASALVLWWHKGQRPTIGSPPTPVQAGAAMPTRAPAHS